MTALPPIIAWDYQFAPNAQKARNYLYATQTLFRICEQPFVLPRPALAALGITYRRVPVLSIGKDVFCDTIAFMDAMQELLGSKGARTSPFDRAFEAWGYRSFWIALPCVPASLVTPQLGADRKRLFPIFAREDFASLRGNGLGELRALFEQVETEFFNDQGPFVGGAWEVGMADLHSIWIIKWCLQTIGVDREPGFSRKEYPRVWRWIESIQKHDDEVEQGQKISQEEASKIIFDSTYAVPDIGVDSTDPVGFKAGDSVAVEANDAEPGTHPQIGKLVDLSKKRVVLGLDNGLKIHFPRVGYVIHQSSGKNAAVEVE